MRGDTKKPKYRTASDKNPQSMYLKRGIVFTEP